MGRACACTRVQIAFKVQRASSSGLLDGKRGWMELWQRSPKLVAILVDACRPCCCFFFFFLETNRRACDAFKASGG